MHQCQWIIVAHRHPVAVDHRQRKSGALQQRAKVANIGEGRNPRRDSAFDLAFRFGEGFAQYAQTVAADHRRQQQTVRLQCALDLDERAGQVIHKLQRQRRHDKIERGIGERQRFLVGSHRQRRSVGRDRQRRCDQSRYFPARGQHTAQRIVRRAEVDGALELPQHHRQPLAHFLGDAVE